MENFKQHSLEGLLSRMEMTEERAYIRRGQEKLHKSSNKENKRFKKGESMSYFKSVGTIPEGLKTLMSPE